MKAARFEGKICLITGGTSGIGYEMAKRMAEEGGRVIVCSVDKNIQEAVQALSQDGKYKVEGLHCDVTDKLQRLQIVGYINETYGRLDVLCLNAGVPGFKGSQFYMDEEHYDQTFAVNVKSVLFFAKDALDLLKKATDGGNILVTSSLSGVMPSKVLGVYAMGKAALMNMVKWLAIELMDFNIRVNAIAPGFTRTEMTADEFKIGIDKILHPRFTTTPDMIASVACMICSKQDGSFVNGETLVLHGGESYPKFKINKQKL
ncbi:hypothetical protein FGO68_gene8391 [Halteria grandinella]|uniref:SDR family oxidoreductase n=1 Tax=Halteria grandinella TaxID=5974 RepID=A0A8J8NIJ4_HALGN|nr:hypothetical protein FGO68_gene8391 [Halteria grandinella]